MSKDEPAEVIEKKDEMIISIKLITPFRKLIESQGVDFYKLSSILKVKSLLDYRKSKRNEANEKVSHTKNNNFGLIGLNLLLGGLFSFFIYILPIGVQVQQSIFYMMMLFFLILNLLTTVADNILNISDKELIMSRDVNEQTYNFAKFVHVASYVLIMSMSFQAPNLLIGTARNGVLFAVISIFTTILISVFALSIVVFLYMILFNFFDGEKLKRITTNINIFISVLSGVGTQVAIRVVDIDMIVNQISVMELGFGSLLMPNIWFSSFFGFFLDGNRTGINIALMGMGILVPLLLFGFYFYNSKRFEENLSKIEKGSRLKRKKLNIVERIGKLITPNGDERTFYNFTNTMMDREDAVKRLVLPQLGLGILFPVLMIFQNTRDVGAFDFGYAMNIVYIYMFLMMVIFSIRALLYSPNYNNAWIYRIAGMNSTVPMFRGATKAFLVKWILFPLIVFSIAIGLIVPDYTVITFLTSIVLLYFLGILSQRMLLNEVIFSIENEQVSGDGFTNVMKFFGLMIAIGIMGVIHYQIVKAFGELALLLALIVLTAIADRIGYANLYKNA